MFCVRMSSGDSEIGLAVLPDPPLRLDNLLDVTPFQEFSQATQDLALAQVQCLRNLGGGHKDALVILQIVIDFLLGH